MSTPVPSVRTDVAIFGGGVAGLWLLGRLRRAGFRAVLLEANALGSGQTRYAQGIIHGGTKYALTGALSASAETVSTMPALWRDCLDGRGELDLSAVRLLSPFQYLWSTASLTSRMAGFFASHAMRSRTEPLPVAERPPLFRDPAFRGQVYRLDEPVLDTASLVAALAAPHREALAKFDWPDGLQLARTDGGWSVHLHNGHGGKLRIEAQRLVLAAGRGNRDLLDALGQTRPEMQLRPLQMVMVRGPLPTGVYAHCLGASSNPRLTISSHSDREGRPVWYLGGQLAEAGVGRTGGEQIAAARQELQRLLPWVDVEGCQWATVEIERAEPLQAGGKRPDDSFVMESDGVLTAWPTKLALAPRLAAAIVERLAHGGLTPGEEANGEGGIIPAQWPRPAQAPLPCQEETRWN